jgi:acylphosphatase
VKDVRLTAVFHGTVQGVGFRYSTHRLAARSLITGFVQNEADGTVLAVVEGQEADVKAFLNQIKMSHLGQLIQRVDESWCPATCAYKSFDISY